MDIYDTNEAAVYLGIAVTTLRQHIQNGNITPTKKGGNYIFTKDELDLYQSNKRKRGGQLGSKRRRTYCPLPSHN